MIGIIFFCTGIRLPYARGPAMHENLEIANFYCQTCVPYSVDFWLGCSHMFLWPSGRVRP